MSNTSYQSYVQRMQKIADLNHATAVLHWDKEVNMPPQGAALRARQLATLDGMSHELFTDKAFGELLQQLMTDASLDEDQRRNVELTLKDYERTTKLDEAFVIRRSKLISKAYQAWLAARDANDFEPYRQPLSDLVELKREEAERYGYEEHPYDALLDIYEPETKASELDVLFRDVRRQLIDFVRALRERPQVSNGFLQQHFPKDSQWEFGLQILREMGYDFRSGRQDLSPHPFTITFSPQDVRVTTRIDEQDFTSMTWSCIHEGGHALYEQGLPTEMYGLPLGYPVSLGIHESQSRLWENHVGRSRLYWQAKFPELQQRFPGRFDTVSLDDFYRGINKIEPSLIRTESDELHYHFHILIRYEIEKSLIEGSIRVDDLEETWNHLYKEYLDLEVPDPRRGILQDIHWAHGSIGYFPTYSLGSFYAAQFFAQAQKDIPGLEEQIGQGNTESLLQWLREKIHHHGRFYNAEDLCRKVTGEALNFKYFMAYAEKKYKEIYR